MNEGTIPTIERVEIQGIVKGSRLVGILDAGEGCLALIHAHTSVGLLKLRASVGLSGRPLLHWWPAAARLILDLADAGDDAEAAGSLLFFTPSSATIVDLNVEPWAWPGMIEEIVRLAQRAWDKAYERAGGEVDQ